MNQADFARLAGLLAQAGRELQVVGSLRVRVVGDSEMARAHDRYLGQAATTDVLTFDLSEPDASGLLTVDADVLICVDEARRQSSARGHGTLEELLLYAIHGLLHCVGHDDGSEAAAARMHAEEDRLLAGLGVGPVYARDVASRPAAPGLSGEASR